MNKIYTLLFILAFSLNFLHGQISITEISYNPPEADNDSLEYLELYNTTDADINLAVDENNVVVAVTDLKDVALANLGQNEINLSALPKGLYLVQLKYGVKSQTRKILKM